MAEKERKHYTLQLTSGERIAFDATQEWVERWETATREWGQGVAEQLLMPRQIRQALARAKGE